MKNLRYTPLPAAIEDEYCANALRKEVRYLLSLEEGRLLAGFCENADLPTPFVRYGGWESGLIGGHTLGHWLSAVSHAVANPAVSKEDRARLTQKLQNAVKILADCQAHSTAGEGFLWGAPRVEGGAAAQFDHVERGRTNIECEAWVPWYTMHKILSGLIDAYRFGGCGQALLVASRLGDWVCARVNGWNASTRKRVLRVEYGGMNDCLYDLYALTGEEKYAKAAHVFDDEDLFDALLSEGKDVLKDKHANTTIPKVLGALNRYIVLNGSEKGGGSDERRYLGTARAFFRIVTERHTYVTGGNSEWERFGADFVLDRRRTNCNCETCNVYNMLKLARLLFAVTGEKQYTDYYDNAFTNSILSSQNPETGMTTYFQPMKGGFFKVFSSPYDSFWCCTGTGMENFSKLGDSAFYEGEGELLIEQYLSARAEGSCAALALSCDFPMKDAGTLLVTRAEAPVTVCFRIPDWADGELAFSVNGTRVRAEERDGHALLRLREGDRVDFRIPLTVTLKGLPDGDALAFRYGGAVLSADLGTEGMRESVTGVDVRIPARGLGSELLWFDDVEDVLACPQTYLVREGDVFRLRGADRPLTFGLHYRRFRERYAVYFRFREYIWEDGRRVKREERDARVPTDTVRAGYGQYESDAFHALQEYRSVSDTSDGSSRRAAAGGWFSYDFAVEKGKRNSLQIALRHADNGKTLKISVEGKTVYAGRLNDTLGEREYTLEVPIPQDIVERAPLKTVPGRQAPAVRVRFEGIGHRASARICGNLLVFAE